VGLLDIVTVLQSGQIGVTKVLAHLEASSENHRCADRKHTIDIDVNPVAIVFLNL